MPRSTPRFCLVTAGLAAGLLAIACSGVRVGQPTSASGPLGKPDFTVTSKDFVKEHDDNPQTAINKYKDKVVEMTGKIMAISYDGDGKPEFYLEGARPQAAGGLWASCLMTDKYPWAKANSGQTVTVKGRGHAGFPRKLVDCEIVNVTGDPAPHMTADEFAKRADNPKKDGISEFVVSGEILDKRDPVNSTSIYLKCQDNKKNVQIHFLPDDYKRLNVANWKPGQKIEVIGTDSTNPGWPWLVNCLPMAEPK